MFLSKLEFNKFFNDYKTNKSENCFQISFNKNDKNTIEFISNINFLKSTNLPIFINNKTILSNNNLLLTKIIRKNFLLLKNFNKKSGIIVYLTDYANNRNQELENIVKLLNELYKNYYPIWHRIIINTSNNEKILGSVTSDFNFIKTNSLAKIGFCIDTSHLFTSGYKINNVSGTIKYLLDFKKKVGFEYISVIYLNDVDINNKPILCLSGNGEIFKNNLVMDFFVSLSKDYNIPIILDTKIDNNLDLLKNKKFKMLNKIDIFFNGMLFLDFLNLVIEYLLITSNRYNEVQILKIIYYDILNSYNFKNKRYLFDKIKKGINCKFISNSILNLDIDIIIKTDLLSYISTFNYQIYLKYYNNKKYQTIKKIKEFIPIETSNIKLLYDNNYDTLEKIMSISYIDKSLLSLNQLNYIKIYKLIYDSKNFNYEEIKNLFIHEDFKTIIIKSSDNKNTIKCLLVIKNKNDVLYYIRLIKQNFEYVDKVLNTNRYKKLLFRYNNIYFFINIYMCSDHEEIFLKLFLSYTKNDYTELQMQLRNNGYILSNYHLFDIYNKKTIYPTSEKEILNLI